tara:strand:+ start:9 stop:221 length:213 start_codon:yes stop_codon:yes gene_type:complete
MPLRITDLIAYAESLERHLASELQDAISSLCDVRDRFEQIGHSEKYEKIQRMMDELEDWWESLPTDGDPE